MEIALEMARKAVTLSPDDYYSHWALGRAYRRTGDFDRALAEYGRVLELNSNDADLLAVGTDKTDGTQTDLLIDPDMLFDQTAPPRNPGRTTSWTPTRARGLYHPRPPGPKTREISARE